MSNLIGFITNAGKIKARASKNGKAMVDITILEPKLICGQRVMFSQKIFNEEYYLNNRLFDDTEHLTDFGRTFCINHIDFWISEYYPNN